MTTSRSTYPNKQETFTQKLRLTSPYYPNRCHCSARPSTVLSLTAPYCPSLHHNVRHHKRLLLVSCSDNKAPVLTTRLAPSPQSSRPCQQTFPCCGVWAELGLLATGQCPGLATATAAAAAHWASFLQVHPHLLPIIQVTTSSSPEVFLSLLLDPSTQAPVITLA